MNKRKLILVTGDPICDHNYYKGKRYTADSNEIRGFREIQTGGGALLLKELIAATMQEESEWTTEFGLNADFKSLPLAFHSYCFWEPQPGGNTKGQSEFWRAVVPQLGYGHPGARLSADVAIKLRADAYSSPNPSASAEVPDILVIDDAGLGFRDPAHQNLWRLGKDDVSSNPSPRWVVLKLTGKIGRSALWEELTGQCKDNLVVIVPAEELRRQKVKISRGVSWEATAEDLTAELRGNSLLRPLLKARHLIITFQFDASYWLNNSPNAPVSLLVFDAARAEGEWSQTQGGGGAIGCLSCSVAAVVRELCHTEVGHVPDFEAALDAGLNACRVLRRTGHGQVILHGSEPEPGFPFNEITREIRQPSAKFVSTPIPQDVCSRRNWMMLDEWQVQARNGDKRRPCCEAAIAAAVLGPEALARFPVAQFGHYQSVDRKEIESLRTVRNLISTYMRQERSRTPLNLGVFGPPGTGKLFAVTQVAKSLCRDEDILTFNLSQFSDLSDLIGAFHQIRDRVVSGTTPLVFWEEFDSAAYKWLQYLLVPMQDGKFQEGQITHPIGKSIFVFTSATCATYYKFGPINPNLLSHDVLERLRKYQRLEELEGAWRQFVLAKGPDFKSLLVGNLNLAGVNRRQTCVEEDGRRLWIDDRDDLCFPIRRALFIRSQFKVEGGARLSVDLGLLRAMLEVPFYKSGARSLHAMCKYLSEGSSGTIDRSSLPSSDFLDLHVDSRMFLQICEQDMEFAPKARDLAEQFQEAFRSRIKNCANKKHLDVSFAELPEDMQTAGLAQALRIPGILQLVRMHLEAGPVVHLRDLLVAGRDDKSEERIRQILAKAESLELLAEAEHNGWMVDRMLNGWRYGRTKDGSKKLHNCLLPYSQLSDDIKGFDRSVIVGNRAPAGESHLEAFGYVDIVKTVGLRVVLDEVPAVVEDSPDVAPEIRSPKIDVFISYRREGGEDLAERVKDALKSRGIVAFMDVHDLKSGRFDTALLSKIEEATDVIVILTPGCLERCKNEGDWLRQEIRHAIKTERNIVPVISRYFEMPLPESLPSDIAELPKYGGLVPSHELFDASIDRLVSTFLKSRKAE